MSLIDRRRVLQYATLVLGGIASPGVVNALMSNSPESNPGASKPADAFVLGEIQRRWVALLSEIIIPRTTTPGAGEAGVPQFIGLMYDQWYTDTERGIFLHGLNELRAWVGDQFGTDIDNASVEQLTASLEHFEQVAQANQTNPGTSPAGLGSAQNESAPFIKQLKELTVLGYFTSEVGVKSSLVYDPMPMTYKGDIPVSEVGDNWVDGQSFEAGEGNMMNEQDTDFDAIVVGSGISGGWAAKELCERGLRVLVLERGKLITHGKDYVTEHMPPWDIPYRGKPLRELYQRDYPIQSKSYAFNETTRHFFANDSAQPYQQTRPFTWTRADVLGGKSLLWARQVYRWSDLDFEANRKDGYGIDWPIRYRDLKPWYDHVEAFAGVSGESLGLDHLPDGIFQQPMELNAVEKHIKNVIESEYEGRHLTIGRTATQTEAKNGRGACHYCGPCERGCSVGAYFSSLSSTLPAADRTGKLTIRCDAVVERLNVSRGGDRIESVDVVDSQTRERHRFSARMVFLCASAMASNQILLNSASQQYPRGLANRSGTLGHYVMDHLADTVYGVMPGFEDRYYYGNRPNNFYVPRFRNIRDDAASDFLRGYGFQGAAMRGGWNMLSGQLAGFGAEFKHALMKPGPWVVFMAGFAEHLPQQHNRVTLDPNKRDQFGIPQIRFDVAFGENEAALRADLLETATDMLSRAGAQHLFSPPEKGAPGAVIHEMGGARMGTSPDESVLNAHNQAHDIPNLFVTDGACMTSSSCVNPSLTFMALTARAADYAATQFKAGRL